MIKPELRKVPGVAEVNSWGGEVKQYHVVVSPPALVKYDLTLGGRPPGPPGEQRKRGRGRDHLGGVAQLVHGIGRVASIPEIEAIVVVARDGDPVYIRDVAEKVVIDHEIRRGAVTADGRGESVLGLAFMLMGENSQEVTRALKTQLDQVRPSLPDDVILEVVYDRTELTNSVIQTVQHNLLLGAVLVVLVLFFLLGNLRAGLIVALAIPFSMLFAVLGMYEFAIAASLLSLGAIDFGIIIDGSVVMTESNLRRLGQRARELGRPLTPAERLQAVADSAKKVARPVAFGIGIILVVFLPIFSLEGIEGKMFKPMAATFILALIGALLLALTLSPVLSYYCLSSRPSTREGFIEGKLARLYERLLKLAIRARKVDRHPGRRGSRSDRLEGDPPGRGVHPASERGRHRDQYHPHRRYLHRRVHQLQHRDRAHPPRNLSR